MKSNTSDSKSSLNDGDENQPGAKSIGKQQQQQQEQAMPILKGRPVELSRKIDIDMDPLKKSPRKEMASLHYNTIHNPKNRHVADAL
jgi:hypothetical protein